MNAPSLPPTPRDCNMSVQETRNPLQEAQELNNKMKSQSEPASKPSGAGYLLTPPDEPYHSFTQEDKQANTSAVTKDWHESVQQANRLPPIQSHSSPQPSPATNVLPSLTSATGYAAHDPPLFPDRAQDRAQSQPPLFENNELVIRSTETQPLAQPTQTAPGFTPVNGSPAFPAVLGITTPDAALKYYNDRMAELKQWQIVRRLPSPRRSPESSLDRESSRQLSSLTRPAGVTKTRSTPKKATKPKAPVAASPRQPKQSPLPPRRRTPKTISDFVGTAFPPKTQESKHRRAAPSKKVEGDDLHWSEIPNYAPPTSALDSNAKKLKAEWKSNNPIDLSNDPDRQFCHEQEVQVAAILRLSCAKYLTSKRKIFQARLQALKDGKNFTKTAAQGACTIDVNKASELWKAFDKAGWFDEEWFQQYL